MPAASNEEEKHEGEKCVVLTVVNLEGGRSTIHMYELKTIILINRYGASRGKSKFLQTIPFLEEGVVEGVVYIPSTKKVVIVGQHVNKMKAVYYEYDDNALRLTQKFVEEM